MTRWLFVLTLMMLTGSRLFAQQLKLGKQPYLVEKSAVLELLSDNQGLLFSRISDTNAINSLIPPDGMVIFFTGTKQLLVRSNGYWQPLLFSAALGNNYWSVNGNSNGALKKLGTTDNFALPFVTNNTEWMRLTTGGNLGIGNTTPSEKLDITGNLKFSGALMPNNAAGTSGYLLTSAGTGAAPTWTNPSTLISSSSWILNGNGVSSLTSFGTTSAFDLPFITSNTERMRLTTTGRLGIGNTAPSEVLDVTGNMKFSGALMPNNAAGTSGYLLTSAGTGAAPTWINPSTLIGSSAWTLGGNGVAAATNFGTTSAFDLPFITSNTERMRLTTTGRLGIGNTTPTEVLDVTGNMKFSGALMPNNAAGTSGYLLTSAGTGAAPTWTNPATVAGSTSWILNGNNVSSVTSIGTTSAFDLPFITSNTERMRLTTTGRLGIGNTVPTEVLDVTGNMKFSGALMPGNNAGTSGYLLTSAGTGTTPTWTNPSTLVSSSAWALGGNGVAATTNFGTTSAFDLPFITSNTERMRLTTTGRLGIGNTSPTEVLDVIGNMKFSGALMPNNAAGTSGYLLTSAGTGSAPTWTNPTTLLNATSWALNGNGVGSTTSIGTTTFFDLPFITSNTERMRLTTSGNLGIGNTTPSEKLDVTGNMKFSGALMPNNTAGTSGYLLTSAGTGAAPTWTNPTTLLNSTSWALNGNNVSSLTSMGTTSFFDLPFITSNTERMRLTTSGNLGIGNTIPSEKLDVTGNMKFSGALMPNNTAGTSGYLLTSAGTGSAPTWTNPSTLIGSSAWSLGGNGVASTTNIGTTTGFDLPFITSNTERMRLTTAGRLGIGNTTPTEILDVTGNMKFSGALMPNNTAGTSGYLLTSAGTGSAPTWTNPTTLLNATSWALNGNGVSSTTSIGTTTFFDLPFITSNTERMRLTTSGNLGIGNTTPSEKLDVTGNMKFSGALMPNNTAGTSGYLLTSAGTGSAPTWTNPTTLLNATSWALNGNGVSSTTSIGTTTFFDLPFITSNTERMRLTTSGNLGIGNTTPSEKLDVTGNMKFSGALMPNNTAGTSGYLLTSAGTGSAPTWTNPTTLLNATSWALNGNNVSSLTSMGTTSFFDLPFITSNTERMRLTTGGRLGIGNTAPTEVLDVTGNMKFSGALMPNNTAGTSGYLLTSAGTGSAPTWTNPSTLIGATAWALGGNSVSSTSNFGTTSSFDLPFITSNTERMRITNTGRVGIGVTNPANPLVVKDTLEIRRTGTLSELLFTNTSGTGDFRIGSDGNDIFWQGGGGRNLQMGAFWTVVLTGDRQSSTFPAYTNGTSGTGVLVQGQRDASVPLAIQANSATQSSNLTEWRNSSGAALSAINNTGRLGLGNNAPSEVLDVTGNMKFSGALMPNNTAGTSGYLLTSAGTGVAPTWTNPSSLIGSSAWALGGNAVTAITNFGTTSSFDLPFITNNTEQMRISSTGNVGIGSSSFDANNPEKLLIDAGTNTQSYNVISGKGTINNYLQLNIQNRSSGDVASSDLVATANNGSETANFVDLGINSSGFTNTVYPIIGGANNAYLYSTGNDFVIGNAISGKNLRFFTGGYATANERMRIDGSGNVGINTTSAAANLDVNGTFKAGAKGTAEKNIVSFSTTLSATTITGATPTLIIVGGNVTFTAVGTDVTVTIPNSANYLTSTQATVSVSPAFDLPGSVSIASARMISTSQVKIRFMNASTTSQSISGTLYVTITEF